MPSFLQIFWGNDGEKVGEKKDKLAFLGGMVARFQNGFFKIYRTLLASDIGENPVRLSLFLHIVSMANIKETTVDWCGSPRSCPRGSLVTSVRELANLVGVDKSAIERQLKYLKKRDTIVVETETRGTFISVRNYNQYQDKPEEGETVNRHQPDTGADTIEEYKNKRINNTPPTPSKTPRPDPLSSRMKVRVKEESAKERILEEYPLKTGWRVLWQKTLVPLLAGAEDQEKLLADLVAAAKHYRAEQVRLKRSADKMKSLPNFYAEGWWEDFVNPPAHEDFSDQASAEDARWINWEVLASRVIKSLITRGTGSRANDEIKQDLGQDLFDLAIKTGCQKIREVHRGEYQIRTVAAMLKTTYEAFGPSDGEAKVYDITQARNHGG